MYHFSNMPAEYHSDSLIHLFNDTFLVPYRTRLVGGGEEPEYLPADNDMSEHQIIFTRDYFSSALHEIAHWCIAGEQRRQQVDYGYWYAPDGRTSQQQHAFEKVEAKPQAIEWLFSRACGIPFRLSADNLTGETVISEQFRQAVLSEVKKLCVKSNYRVSLFSCVLADYFSMSSSLSPADFSLSDL